MLILYTITLTAVIFSLITLEPNEDLMEEIIKINSNLSLDIGLEKKIIHGGNKQTIEFFLNDTSDFNKKLDVLIEGNIIYLSGLAESFSLNITNNQKYNYSWMINPKIQSYGTVLLEVNVIYNGISNAANLSFYIDTSNKNEKNKHY